MRLVRAVGSFIVARIPISERLEGGSYIRDRSQCFPDADDIAVDAINVAHKEVSR
jgi:hypothetical protein